MKEKNTFQLDHSIGYWIAMAEILTKRNLTNHIQNCSESLTPEQWNILNRLWESDGRTQKELAESLFKDMANITRILNVMERRALVKRVKDSSDARIQRVYLTPKGNKIKEEVLSEALKAIEKSTKGISKEEIEQTISTLKKILKNLS
jgi:DNA-binding MarR family transcriptional regulator